MLEQLRIRLVSTREVCIPNSNIYHISVINNAAMYAPMIKQLKPLYPDFEGPSTPEQSVDKMLQVIDSTTIADSGTFVSHNGNKKWL
jgi:hypothetical protein